MIIQVFCKAEIDVLRDYSNSARAASTSSFSMASSGAISAAATYSSDTSSSRRSPYSRYSPLPYSIRAIGARGVSSQRFAEVLERLALAGAVGHATDELAHLVDDFGVVHAQRGVRFGMQRLQFERSLQAVEYLAADALAQGLDHRDALAVAAQVEGVKVMAVGVVRKCLDGPLGALDGRLETFDLLFWIRFQVGRVDAGGLVGDRVARQPTFVGERHGLLEIAPVKTTPGFLQFAALG